MEMENSSGCSELGFGMIWLGNGEFAYIGTRKNAKPLLFFFSLHDQHMPVGTDILVWATCHSNVLYATDFFNYSE